MKNKKIKLLVVTPYLFPESGGIANHVYNLYRKFKKRYFEVVIITSSSKEEGYKEEFLDGMKIYRLPYQFKVSNTPISFKWKKQIRKIIEKEHPEVIMGHMPVTFICDITLPLTRKKRIPFILKYHHGGSMKKGRFPIDILILFYEKIFLRKLLRNSDLILTSSEDVTNNFMKNYKDKTHTITPAVNSNLFKPTNLITKNDVLFVGNLLKSENYKNLDILIEAISIVKKKFQRIKLSIVGDGDYKEYYRNLSNSLGLSNNVQFMGKLNSKNLVNEYNNSKLIVLPSSMESFGMVLIEAMACKKPVIGSNIGGIPYVIDDCVNGLLTPPKDPTNLAEAIIKILNNPKLAKQMGENGYKKVKEKFTWDKKAKETVNLIKRVLVQK